MPLFYSATLPIIVTSYRTPS